MTTMTKVINIRNDNQGDYHNKFYFRKNDHGVGEGGLKRVS